MRYLESSHKKHWLLLFVLAAAICVSAAQGVRAGCCVAPDNGSGTVLFPADCPYAHPSEPMVVTDGLPPVTSLVLSGPLAYFYNVNNSPGGSLNGEICTFEGAFDFTVSGTGVLSGYMRHIYVPVTGEIHIGPRNPGDPVQCFPARIISLDGQLFGDPDFCLLRLRAGDAHNLPCPGQTLLTELPGGDFAVDSFFDITCRIEYTGCPGSPLDGYSGVDEKRVPRTTCDDFYLIDWCRLQWPHIIDVPPGTSTTVYGRFYIPGVTGQTTGNDVSPGRIRGQVGYGPDGSDPSAGGWTWFEAFPNPVWDGSAWGEPNNDEYMADIIAPIPPGDYDFCVRFSGDVGHTWLYGDRDTGLPGEDGSENGYQSANAGQMTVSDVCCVAPDNGSGTADFPADCDYDRAGAPMLIVDGLPPGTTMELAGPLTDFHNVASTPGGILGGEICDFEAALDLLVSGTGTLYGFTRHLYVPVYGQIHTGPRTPGDPQQFFPTVMYCLYAELFGDPDFCEFRITSGPAYGLPCPGLTLLTELPSGDFAVESFFDVTYELEFQGCPGGPLDGYAGTTRRTVPRTTCTDFYTVDWCRLQWPHTIGTYAGTDVVVYGRFYVPGLTDRSQYNDLAPAQVRGQVGYGPSGSDPAIDPAWTWVEATPNPGWDGSTYGEPNNDEYWANLVTPPTPGTYDYCYRFSGDAGLTWLYADRNTGLPGEDGSENGYQPANAGKMTVWDYCCPAPDNGSGTVDFPPDCAFGNSREPMYILDGLPLGTTIELWGPLTAFQNVVNVPGGTLGGEICTFDAYFEWNAKGTGTLLGFTRMLYVPVSGEIHIGPRSPGDPVQAFEAVIYELSGQLFGDPDFCTLIVTAGDHLGLLCPGAAQLTELPGGDFWVDSFFDVTYRLQFQGCPGSIIDGYAGTTFGQTLKATCSHKAAVPAGDQEPVPPKRARLAAGVPNPFSISTTLAYSVPGDSQVSLKVYDATGRLVKVLADGRLEPGDYRAYWDGTDEFTRPAPPGVYFFRLTAGEETATNRAVLLR